MWGLLGECIQGGAAPRSQPIAPAPGGLGAPHVSVRPSQLPPPRRYNTLPRPVTQQLSSPEVVGHGGEDKPEQATSIGQIKPELYKQRAGEAEHRKAEGPPCGRISFALRYAYASEQLVVKILRALDLPAKDANGFSDPYVKMYLLPDRKKKFQTKVHRKTLNPVFNETFNFNVPFAELPGRKLHFSVYDFDRFSRHDLIGQVVLDNLLEMAERDEETPIWRDILEGSSVSEAMGDGGGRGVGCGRGERDGRLTQSSAQPLSVSIQLSSSPQPEFNPTQTQPGSMQVNLNSTQSKFNPNSSQSSPD